MWSINQQVKTPRGVETIKAIEPGKKSSELYILTTRGNIYKESSISQTTNIYESVQLLNTGRAVVDESLIDLNYVPGFEIKPWEPARELPPYDTLKRCYLDIETSGLDPDNDRVYFVGFLVEDSTGESYHFVTDPDEESLLKSALKLLKKIKPRILSGHNHFTFDLHFLMARWDRYSIPHPFKKADWLTNITSASMNGSPIRFNQVFWKGVDIIDTFQQAAIYDKVYAVLDGYSLKDVAIAIGSRDERRLELSHSEINDCWETGNFERIREYLQYDLEDTKALSDFFIPQIYYQSIVIPLPLQEIAIASPPKKWEAVLNKHYGRDYAPIADDPYEYVGGYVSCEPGLYKNVCKIDVSSLYPSIQLKYGLCSQKDTDHYSLSVLKYLKDKRLEFKAIAKSSGSKQYDAMQNAFKILLNGFYGYAGTSGYAYNCFKTAALVTAIGRMIVNRMIDISKDFGGEVVEVDTDAVMVVTNDATALHREIESKLPDGITTDLEWSDRVLYALKPKNYLTIDSDGKVKSKGVFRKRNRSYLQTQFPIEYLKLYVNSPVEAEKFFEDVLSQICNGDYPVENLSIKQKISKSDKRLTAAGLGHAGDVVTYYEKELKRRHKVNGKQLKSDRTPTRTGAYYYRYYAEKLLEIRREMLTVIGNNLFDPEIDIPTEDKQMRIF